MKLRAFITELFVDLPLDEIVDELTDFDERFQIILRKHIAVLGWWSLVNVLAGIAGMVLAEGLWKYFFMMNAAWGFINAGVTHIFIRHTFFRKFRQGNILQRFEVQRHAEKVLLLNIGLDLAYITTGLYLKALGLGCNALYADLWFGFGWSVILQGIYLFVQDNIFHYLHYLNIKKAKPFMMGLMRREAVD